jgi:O-antigen/teichoic acid export membrane protein
LNNRFRADAFWSSAGTIAPIVAGALATPFLLAVLGAQRFAIYALSFAIVSFAPALDLGISRTAFRRIAAAHSTNPYETPAIVNLALRASWTVGLSVTLLFGGTLAIVSVFAGADWIPTSAAVAVALALLTVPPAIVGNTQRGVLEGAGRFEASAGIRITLGMLVAIVPLLLALVTRAVELLVLSQLVLRIATVWIQRRILRGAGLVGPLAAGPAVASIGVASFRQESSWFGLAAIVSLLMSGFDRFVILALTGMTLVDLAAFIAPQEVALRAIILPAAFVPALMVRIAKDDSRGSQRVLLSTSMYTITAVVFAGCLLATVLARDIATHVFPTLPSTGVVTVIQLLALGIFSNAVAQFPAAVLNGRGLSRVPATLQLVELPVFLLALPVLIARFGVSGAAMAWSLRIAVDTVLLLQSSSGRVPQLRVPGWHALHFGGLILLGAPLLLG